MRSVRRVTTSVLLLVAGNRARRSFRVAAATATMAAAEAAPTVVITITNCDTTTYAADGVFCFDFTATGPGRLLRSPRAVRSSEDRRRPLEEAYEVPPGLAAQLGISPPSDSTNLEIQFDGPGHHGPVLLVRRRRPRVHRGVRHPVLPDARSRSTARHPLGPLGRLPRLGTTSAAASTQPLADRRDRRRSRAARASAARTSRARTSRSPAATRAPAPVSRPSTPRTASRSTSRPSPTRRTPIAARDAQRPHRPRVLVLPRPGHRGDQGPDHGRRRLRRRRELRAPTTPRTSTASRRSRTRSRRRGGNMNVARRGHTATWIPSNKVVIIGGETGGPSRRPARLDRDLRPAASTPSSSSRPALSFPRRGHTRDAAADRQDPRRRRLRPGAPRPPLPAELFDPVTPTVMSVRDQLVDRISHTATRLANGWVLLAGGKHVVRAACSARRPTSSSPSSEAWAAWARSRRCSPMMSGTTARLSRRFAARRRQRAADRRRDRRTVRSSRTSAEIFLPQTLTFTPTIPMVDRARGAQLDADELRPDRRRSAGATTSAGHDLPQLARDVPVRQHEPRRRERVHRDLADGGHDVHRHDGHRRRMPTADT